MAAELAFPLAGYQLQALVELDIKLVVLDNFSPHHPVAGVLCSPVC